MKQVPVLQLDEVKIARFHWWSKWQDVCLYNHALVPYLVQMRVSRTNAKQFKVRPITPWRHNVHSVPDSLTPDRVQ